MAPEAPQGAVGASVTAPDLGESATVVAPGGRLLKVTAGGVREIRVDCPSADPGVDLDRVVRDLMSIALGAADPSPFVAAAHAICAMKKSKPAVATAGSDDFFVRPAPAKEEGRTYAL